MRKKTPVLLITGASQRLGAALAEAFGARGYAIVLHARKQSEQALATCARIQSTGAACVLIEGDLTEASAAEGIFARAVAAFGRVDYLINNASRFIATGIEEADSAHYAQEMHLHATAPYLLTRALYLHLKARDCSGAVINICDASLAAPKASKPAYYAAKGALREQSRVLAAALGPTLRINSLSPGPILEGASDGLYYEKMEQLLPVRRTGRVKDLIEAAQYLLEASFVTGIDLVVDGGAHLL